MVLLHVMRYALGVGNAIGTLRSGVVQGRFWPRERG